MAKKTDVKEAPARDEMQVSLGPDPANRKVELDLDDAPFLKDEQKDSSPAVQEKNLPAETAPAAKTAKKQKIFLAGGAALVLALALTAGWWFFLRTPPPVIPTIKPEVIVVPSPPTVVPVMDYVKELAPFVVPHQIDGETRFLVCKFSTISKSPNVGSEMDHKMLLVRDALFFYLSGRSDDYLLNPNNAASIKENLTIILNDYLSSGHIEDVLFESYLAD